MRQSNHSIKLDNLIKSGQLKRGQKAEITFKHEDKCSIEKNFRCSCDPDLKLVTEDLPDKSLMTVCEVSHIHKDKLYTVSNSGARSVTLINSKYS